MVHIAGLRVQGFRLFASAQWEFIPGINWLVGPNGSGKTAVLEACATVSQGRSFRTHQLESLIKSGEEKAVLWLQDNRGEEYAWEKTARNTRLWHNGRTALRSDVARALPLLLCETQLYHMWSSGSGLRRRWFNWGVFHAFPESGRMLLGYAHVLKQRNRVLKHASYGDQLSVWDPLLVQYAESVHRLRSQYWCAWKPVIEQTARAFMWRLHGLDEFTDWELQYEPGWDLRCSFAETLAAKQPVDRLRGHTVYGPHRADVQWTVGGMPVQQRLSRGEQKTLGFALQLSQLLVLKSYANLHSIVLIDDLCAELDRAKTAAIVEWLAEYAEQVIITSIEMPDPAWKADGVRRLV